MTGEIGMFTMLKDEVKVSGGLFGVNELDDVFVFDD